jgi:hypothetical protein
VTLEHILRQPAFSLPQQEKAALLLPLLRILTAHHVAHCPSYAKIIKLTAPDYQAAQHLHELPYLPVALFKHRKLVSVAETAIRATVTSSGTSGEVSRIALDAETAKLQARTLTIIMQSVLGHERLPMLIIDRPTSIADKNNINARAAGILGLMPLGRDHVFALDGHMQPDTAAISQFLLRHGQKPFLLFGFTFVAWQHFYQPLRERGFDLRHGILLHSGGWKKLHEQAVDNQTFRSSWQQAFGLKQIRNFYGMAEQTGSVFVENSAGHLTAPACADIIIRDPLTLQPVPDGDSGVIQVLSPLPHSYPGHALLTEDVGRIVSIDGGEENWLGKAFVIEGRLPRAPLRGCGDPTTTGGAA